MTALLNFLFSSSPTFGQNKLECLSLKSILAEWKGSNRKQSARWQHISRLKANAFCIWQNKLWWFKTQQLLLGTGTAIWWVKEPRW